MKKVIIHGLITILLFFGLWFALKQVDWMTIFKVEKNIDRLEEKLGDMFVDFYGKDDSKVEDAFIREVIDSLVHSVCKANEIDENIITVHIYENDEVNAFALPAGHLVIYTGLVKESMSQEELAGVISHEIAHIELGHVMKKLMKEIGLSTLLSVSTGTDMSGMREVAKVLSSAAYDRTLESEADLKAVDYMVNAGINPSPFAGFLYRTPDLGNRALSWVSTHPDSEERANAILEAAKNRNIEYRKVISEGTWERMIGDID